MLITAVATIAVLSTLPLSHGGEPWTLEQMVTQGADGQAVYHSLPVDPQLLNPISEREEREFQQRARYVITEQSQRNVPAGNTYFENEKRTYGLLMAQALGSRGMDAVRDLQLEDAQADEWHRETQGIDYYACFTLKHQMRKYFYFHDLLEPAYRTRMLEGARRWTETDPLRRPHYAFRAPGGGWGPDVKNSWVDVRSTENLFLMRVTSIYLMAEETGNQQTAAQYKQIVLDYAKTLYRIGMGEWDSENYHGHSIAPLANLYDFSRDPQVKLAAKACLDWMLTTGALKYYRGGFQGPSKRDYNHLQPFGGSAANMLWIYFGDCPAAKTDWESDEVHSISSAYRPPAAVVHLARKQFDKPVEVFASKPQYSATTTFDIQSGPEYLETQFIGHSFMMGSLASGTTPGASDVNGFKILVDDVQHGARTLQAVPGPDPACPGSPLYQEGKVAAANRVAQYRNLAIWLVKDGRAPWRWVIPQSVRVTQQDQVTLLQCDRTWVAIHALGTSPLQMDAALTEQIAGGDKPRFLAHRVLAAAGQGGDYCGLAIEVGEAESHGSWEQFCRQAAAAQVDRSQLDRGTVQYTAADGKQLGCHWHDDPRQLGVWRDGTRHDWQRHAAYLYRSEGTNASQLIHSQWGEGVLTVESSGDTFRCAVDDQGNVVFQNTESETESSHR